MEVGITSYKIVHHDERANKERIYLHLDLLDEVRVATEQRMTRYQDLMAKRYNAKVKPRDFSTGDFVLRKVTTATKDPTQGKLGLKWEGPYRIIDCNKKGVPTTWRCSMDKDCSILGISSTSEDTINSAPATTYVIAFVITFL